MTLDDVTIRRQLKPFHDQIMVLSALFCVIFIIALIVHLVAGFNLFKFEETTPEQVPFILYGCPLGALVGAVIAIPRFLGFFRLRNEGVALTARVTGFGRTRGASQDVKYEYEFHGKTYSDSATRDKKIVSTLKPGDTLPVIVDPRKPGRNLLLMAI